MPYKDPLKAKEYQRKYRLANKEKLKLQNLSWRENNKEHLIEYDKLRNSKAETKEQRKIYNYKYYVENSETLKNNQRKYYLNNKEEIKLRYNPKRRKNHYEFNKQLNNLQSKEWYNKNKNGLLKEWKIKNGLLTGTKQTVPERNIEQFLVKNNIKFEAEKTFENCKNKCELPFDFYLSDLNLCIEFDGPSHYIPIYGEEKLKNQQYNDSIKTEYCKQNGIKLVRISYKQNLQEELNKLL